MESGKILECPKTFLSNFKLLEMLLKLGIIMILALTNSGLDIIRTKML